MHGPPVPRRAVPSMSQADRRLSAGRTAYVIGRGSLTSFIRTSVSLGSVCGWLRGDEHGFSVDFGWFTDHLGGRAKRDFALEGRRFDGQPSPYLRRLDKAVHLRGRTAPVTLTASVPTWTSSRHPWYFQPNRGSETVNENNVVARSYTETIESGGRPPQHLVEPFMRPERVAVIGASRRHLALGNLVLRNLRAHGFPGEVFVVSAGGDEIEGFATVASIEDLPRDLDAVLVSLPAGVVTSAVERLDKQQCRGAIIPTAGFSDAELATLVESTQSLAMPVAGPNCLGILSAADRAPLWTARMRRPFPLGPVALVSQSGSAAISLMTSKVLGFSRVISSGNEICLTTGDYLSWLAQDDETIAVGVVLEGLKDELSFSEGIEALYAAGKRIVVLKVGRSPTGSLAVHSHTGALIGSQALYEAYFRAHDVPMASDYDELIATLQCMATLGSYPSYRGRVAIYGISGGETALACDLAGDVGVTVAQWSDSTEELIRKALPGTSGTNPIDLGASVRMDERDDAAALRAVLEDDAVDAVLVVQDAQSTLPVDPEHSYVETVEMVRDVSADSPKPVVVVSTSAAETHAVFDDVLGGSRIPLIPTGLRSSLVALRNLIRTHGEVPERIARSRDQNVLEEQVRRVNGVLPLGLTQQLLGSVGLLVPRSLVVPTASAALERAGEIGYPLAVKVCSVDVPHRGKVGGVVIGVKDEAGLVAAVASILANVAAKAPMARVEGLELQEMASGAIEAAVGFKTEWPFPPSVSVGLGGALVEVMDDLTVELAPVSVSTARRMIQRTRLGRLFEAGVFGEQATELDGLAEVLHRLSVLAAEWGDLLTEGDLNPVIITAGEGRAHVVDALLMTLPEA